MSKRLRCVVLSHKTDRYCWSFYFDATPGKNYLLKWCEEGVGRLLQQIRCQSLCKCYGVCLLSISCLPYFLIPTEKGQEPDTWQK